MKYYVTFRVSAVYTAAVDCESAEEAKDRAEYCFYDADFGDAEDVEAELIVVEDENGDVMEWC